MPNMQERLDAAVDKAEVDTGLLHTIVHSSITTEVTTEGGKVPSVAKVLNDMRVLMEADEAILYLIANGDSTTIVHTKNGDVPSAAKIIHDTKTAMDADAKIFHDIANGDTTTVVHTDNGDVPSAAKIIHDTQTALDADAQIFHDIANGDADTVVHTENGDVPSVAKAIQDTRNTIQSGTNDLVEQAQTAATTATEQATQSKSAALRAIEAETASKQALKDAQTGVDGTDEEVEALGGRHSAREWVELAEETTKGSFPTTVSGVATANQTILPLPEALGAIDQVLMVSVENLSLMPDTYTLSNDGNSVILQYPLSVNERWCVKYLTDFQSMGAALDAVLYEDM